jgi:hypothetical protein
MRASTTPRPAGRAGRPDRALRRLALLSGLLAGCGGGADQLTVTIGPAGARVTAGRSFQFSAAVAGGSSTLAWSVVEPAGGSIDATGRYAAPLPAAISVPTTFHVRATAATGASDTAPVVVYPEPYIASFQADPAIITLGQVALLSAVFGGGAPTLEPADGDLGTGSTVVRPVTDTLYLLTVTNGAGDAVEQATSVAVVAAPVLEVPQLTPDTIAAGGSFTVRASFSGGTARLTTSPAVTGFVDVPFSGALQVGPVPDPGSYTITVTVTNAAGTALPRFATLTVN